MLGAVVGDIIGSAYEFGGIKTTDFPLFSDASRFTDDTVIVLSVARALMGCMSHYGDRTTDESFTAFMKSSMRKIGRKFPDAGYGRGFNGWLFAKHPRPYESWGNLAAVRATPIAWAFDDLESVENFAKLSAELTHTHPEAVRGAQSMAGAVFLARTGHTKGDIRSYITGKYGYDLSRSIDAIRPEYAYSSACPRSVPEAFTAFLEGQSFEEVIRLAVSLGGDSDTLAAMSGAIAEPFYGIPTLIQVEAFGRLHRSLQYIAEKWEQWRN